MLSFFYNGLYPVFVEYLAIMLHIVNQQLKYRLDASLTGFHFFSFMNQSSKADVTMLLSVCESQATFAAQKAAKSKMKPKIAKSPQPCQASRGFLWIRYCCVLLVIASYAHDIGRSLLQERFYVLPDW